jgi:hypothetical protein
MVGATGAKADPAKTMVQDTLYRADGSAAHGTIAIRWIGFSTSAGEAVAAGETTFTTDANGGIVIPLIPNTGSTPFGSYYKVVIKLDDGTTSEEQWVVPSAASTTVAAIRAKVVPQAVAAQFVSRDYVDSLLSNLPTAKLPVPTATTLGGIKGNGTSLTCTAGQVLSGFNSDGSPACVAVSSSGSYLPLAGGSLTGPLNGSVGAFSGTVAAGTTVSARDSITKSTPVADIRSYGATCDGVTDDTAALQAAITAINSTGGKIGTFGNCYFANPAQLVWGNSKTILISGQGSWTVGTTFDIPNSVHIFGDGGGQGTQFQSRPLFTINGKITVGTLGTATAIGTATFTPSSMTGIVPGAAISVAGSQTCTITSVARASNKVTATLNSSCRTPAGTQVTIAGVTDTSFNGSFLETQSDYGKNTISWQQTASDGSSSGGTLVGVNEKSIETVAITATTSTTATATFLVAHSSSDQFGVVVIAALNQLGGFSLQNLTVGGCGGSCIWLEHSANFSFDNVGAGPAATPTSVALELSSSWWGTIDRSVFLNNTAPPYSQPWGAHFDENNNVSGDSTGMLNIKDTTIGGGVKIDSRAPIRPMMAGQVAFNRLIVERPVTAAIVIEPGGSSDIGTVTVNNLMTQDNFAGYTPCDVYYTDPSAGYSGGHGGFNLTQDVGLTSCVSGGYFDGTMNSVVRNGSTRSAIPTNTTGVWNNGKALEAEIRGEGAGMSPQLIPYPTANIPDPTTWASGACTVTQGVTAPDGSSTAVALSYGTAAGRILEGNISYTTNTGDYFVYGAWVKAGAPNTTPFGGDGYPFYIQGPTTDAFLNIAGVGAGSAVPGAFQSWMTNDWWTPVVAVAQLKIGDGGAHSYGFEAECPGNGLGSLQMWGPFMMHLPASTPVEEVQRLRQQVLHGYVPPNMPGGPILGMNPNHKLYWGSDTNLYRGGAGVVKTDGSLDAGGYKCGGIFGTSGQVLGTTGTACQWVSATGSVTGPVTSVVGNIAIFNSTNGQVLKDIGVQATGFSTPIVLDFKTTSAPTGATGSNPWTYTLPTNAHTLMVVVMSAGSGGGSGGVAATGGNTFGGGGGQGGCAQVYTVPASYFGGAGTAITVTVGAGGAGGTAVSGSGTAVTGNNGVVGGISSISGSNGVSMGAGYSGSGVGSGGSTASGLGAANNCAMVNLPGSPGFSGSLTVGAAAIDGTAPKAAAGGSGGGGVSASGTVASAGGAQGNGGTVQEQRMPAISAKTGGVAPGGAGQTPTIVTTEPMVFGALGGTGGASSTTGNGGAGGAGMFPGGGGAGGGASVPGFSSGAGGRGGDGIVRIMVQ